MTCARTPPCHGVPTEKVTEFSTDGLMAFNQIRERPELKARLDTQYDKIEAARELNHMMRFDCCTTAEIKYRLGNGEPEWREAFLDLPIDDMRAYDIVAEYPRETGYPVWHRPWVDAKIVNGYPVEYRVFVKDGHIAGVSSYYPQRPLSVQGMYSYWAGIAAGLTARLIVPLKDRAPFEWHHSLFSPKDLDMNGVHFTADFMVLAGAPETIPPETDVGNLPVRFLEGGPPHELGAHPCCYRPHEIGKPGMFVLSDQNPKESE